jgi:hypothetical protein
MYKIIECDQRSPEWFAARLGKHTGSAFKSLITPTGKPSASAEGCNNRLVAELILGRPDETFQSEAMLRGAELEDEALEFINFTHGYNFKKVGFIKALSVLGNDLGYGVSADAIDESVQIGLEMKVPSAHTHIEYITAGTLPPEYKPQVQGGMLVTGFKKWVFMSYHPEIKPLVIIVERDEAYIETLREILMKNCAAVREKHKLITAFLED